MLFTISRPWDARAAGPLVAAAALLLGCHEDSKPAPEASASAAVTPMGMTSAAAITATSNAVETLAKGHHPKELALGKDQLYFTDAQDDSPGAGIQAIDSAPLAAGGASQPVFPAQLGAEGLAFASGRLVWITAPSDDQKQHSKVMSANPGAKPAMVARTYDLDETSSVSDGTSVFTFGDVKDTKVLSADVLRVGSNGKATTVTTSGPHPVRTALATNSTHVFWAQDGAIVRAPKTGGDVAVVAKLPDLKIQRIAADDTAVYWTDLGTGDRVVGPRVPGGLRRREGRDGVGRVDSVRRRPRRRQRLLDLEPERRRARPGAQEVPGATFVLARDLHEPRGLAVDDKYVYWVNAGDGAVCRVEKTPHAKP